MVRVLGQGHQAEGAPQAHAPTAIAPSADARSSGWLTRGPAVVEEQAVRPRRVSQVVRVAEPCPTPPTAVAKASPAAT